MVRKKKASGKPVRKQPRSSTQENFFMGLTRSQARSLAIGTVIVGIGLFALAGLTWKNKSSLGANVFPTAALTKTSPTPAKDISLTSAASENGEKKTSPSKMISATSTARLNDKQTLVKKLPNTTSKVTYTVEEYDNLATIEMKLCGKEDAWESIAETNQLLYPYIINAGETYIITCQ